MNQDTDLDLDELKLAALLDRTASDELLDVLRSRLQSGAALRIDASDVETITLPCIQILVAALRSHDRISIKRPSNIFVSAFQDLGLDWTCGRTANPLEPNDDSARPEAVESAHCSTVKDGPMAKRILTIDDSKTIRDMLMLTLKEAGFDVLQAVDGQNGVDVLSKESVDIVITDINMPKMDGYGVIRHMRSMPRYKNTPVFVLTTESEADKKNLAREAGATGWIVKPFDPERLVETINRTAP